MLPCHAYLSVAGGELVGKVLEVDLWFGQGLDQDIHRPVLCHFAKAVFPPIVHRLEKFCVLSSLFVTTHPSHVVSKKDIWIHLRELPKMLNKVSHLVVVHLPPSHMVE